MSDEDLEFELCDPGAVDAPAGWAEAVGALGLHRAWDWSVVRTAAAGGRSRLLAGMLRAGERVVGLATARFYAAAGLVDVDCPGTSALPGIALAGGIPPGLRPAPWPATPPPVEGASPVLFEAALRAFESGLRRELGRRVQLVLYRQLYGAELPVAARGASLVREGAPVAVLHNRFADHDGYLRSLTKSRRVDQRRLVRNVDADPDVSVWIGPATEAALDVDVFFRLNRETARRNHTVRWPPLRYWSREMFATVLALPAVDVIRYTDPAGGLIAASLVFDHPLAPVLGPWGARPLGPERRSGLWFDHLDRLIRRTVTAGCPLLIGGKGRSTLKESLGFRPVRQWSVLRRPVR